jgi:hypothetical protein
VLQTPIGDDAADEGEHRQRELRHFTRPEKARRRQRAPGNVCQDDGQFAAQRDDEDRGRARIDDANGSRAPAALDDRLARQSGENFVGFRILFS